MGVETAVQTIGEHAHGKYVPVLGQICKCNVRRPFSYHQVRRDQALEDDRPCRVMEPVLERQQGARLVRISRVVEIKIEPERDQSPASPTDPVGDASE